MCACVCVCDGENWRISFVFAVDDFNAEKVKRSSVNVKGDE